MVTISSKAIKELLFKAQFNLNGNIHLWSLCTLLMQVSHLEDNNCLFFHAIDHHANGHRVVFTMLPSAAPYECNAVLAFLLLLELVYSDIHVHSLNLIFTDEAHHAQTMER